MIFRKTEEKDKKQVISLWREAQAYFREQEIDQWQDGYPDEACLDLDVAKGSSYVLEDAGRVIATAFISFDGEPDYLHIEGKWITDGPYGVIHRVAVAGEAKGRGLAGRLVEEAVSMCREQGVQGLRVDTHQDNRSMRRMLTKNGFTYCGIIHLTRDGAPRVAYERLI